MKHDTRHTVPRSIQIDWINNSANADAIIAQLEPFKIEAPEGAQRIERTFNKAATDDAWEAFRGDLAMTVLCGWEGESQGLHFISGVLEQTGRMPAEKDQIKVVGQMTKEPIDLGGENYILKAWIQSVEIKGRE